jgi:hypothetical protein
MFRDQYEGFNCKLRWKIESVFVVALENSQDQPEIGIEKIHNIPITFDPTHELEVRAVENLGEELNEEMLLNIDSFFADFDRSLVRIVDSYSAATLLATNLF